MSLPRGFSQAGIPPGSLVPVRSRLAKRFYEPIVFLLSLNEAWECNHVLKAPDLSVDMAQSLERAFHCFVNKLGQLCHSKQGGDTVTAFVVLKLPDVIQYRFASNQRKNEDLIRTKSFVTYVLQTLGRADVDELQDKISHILRKSLAFARPRLGSYVKSLKKNIALCISACKIGDTEESNSILEALEKLQLLCFLDSTELDENAFSESCKRLIYAIEGLHQSEVDELIRNQTKEDKMDESKCWREFRHAAGRLLSHLQAVKVLVLTRNRCPELFENFEVCFVASSSPDPCPFRNKNKLEVLSMKDIIGRMTSDQKDMESYRACAQELEKFGMDEAIQKQAGHKTFRPIVHAEVLLLESLEKDGGTHSSRFFNGYRYIGCCKPTCRLCDYYFSFHASGVEVRPTHRNLYLNWRMPDVYQRQGPKANKERENLMNKILSQVRVDTFRTLTEKAPERKHHDSNTEPTYPIDSILNGEPDDMENLAAGLKEIDIGYSGDEALPYSSPRVSFDAGEVFATESDDGEGSGGVKS